jgi:hypothetical protein
MSSLDSRKVSSLDCRQSTAVPTINESRISCPRSEQEMDVPHKQFEKSTEGGVPSGDEVESQLAAPAFVTVYEDAALIEPEHKLALTGQELSSETVAQVSDSDGVIPRGGAAENLRIFSPDAPPADVFRMLYLISDVQRMNDNELQDVLRRDWGCKKKLEVWGELTEVVTADTTFVKLHNVRSIQDNVLLSYPCDIAHNLQITKRGIYISPSYGRKLFDKGNKFIRCEVELSLLKERAKRGNPLEVQVKAETAISLKKVPIALKQRLVSKHFISTEDATLISNAVFEHFVELKKHEIAEVELALKAEVENNIKAAEQILNETLVAHEGVQAKALILRNECIEIERDKSRLEDAVIDLKNSQIDAAEKLDLLLVSYEETEKKLSQHLEHLRNYIEDKAVILKQLGFVDAEEFELLFADRSIKIKQEGWLNFEQDLGSDYARAVSYIQAHLLQRDILYPRHVVENFFTLLRTNDLIVLAGDSGSGKTNLVQSFAEAIGGVAKIIPVKPNWTSSEDLLGYYNPLDKKYLPTPFLEALIEASKNPAVPYLICLDEMNLARVEYYFADFLSKLEQRDGAPEIELFSDSESAHVLSEIKHVIDIIRGAKERYQKDDSLTFVKLLQDEEINAELRRAFGFSEQDSLIKYHSDIRRMLAGALNTPSSVRFPLNVRIIGAINIDETTHYLSPKILDRAHVMKFKSPLLTDWQSIIDQVSGYEFEDVSKPLELDIAHLGKRVPYPKFDPSDSFCQRFVRLNREYFHPLGVEFGLRTIRQGLNYIRIFSELNDDVSLAINNFVLHKVLPKLTFDGTKETTAGVTKLDLLFGLAANFGNDLKLDEDLDDEFSAEKILLSIANKAKANDGIVNYWS